LSEKISPALVKKASSEMEWAARKKSMNARSDLIVATKTLLARIDEEDTTVLVNQGSSETDIIASRL